MVGYIGDRRLIDDEWIDGCVDRKMDRFPETDPHRCGPG